METRSYRLTFLTPAFLGDAEQNARWRTPPIKHLLREWWRVAWMQKHGFRTDPGGIDDMRAAEGRLFGNAWLGERDGGHRRSRIRLRLDSWQTGRLTTWESSREAKAFHPEVGKGGNGMPVGAELYLGYGPLNYDRQARGTGLKANAAIQPGESATLRIAAPAGEIERLDRVVAWIDRFGALGGRSRNGWGAFRLVPQGEPASSTSTDLPLRDWQDALVADWAHAIGADERGALVWQTKPFEDWHALMQAMAKLKIDFRTRFRFTTGRGAPRPEARHWLSYPVTNHDVRGWRNLRLPNSLRFTATEDEAGRLRGLVYHMPVRPTSNFRPDDRAIREVWQTVHAHLDHAEGLDRTSA